MLGHAVPYQLAEVDSRSVLPGLACLSLPAMAIIKGSLHKHPQDYTQCCKSCAKQREFLNVKCALAHQAPMLQSQLAADLNKKPFKFNGLYWISILHEEYKFKWIQVHWIPIWFEFEPKICIELFWIQKFEFEWFVLNLYSSCHIQIQNKPLHTNFWRLKKMTTPGDIHKGCRKFEKKQERTDSEIREGKEWTNEMSRPKAKCGP